MTAQLCRHSPFFRVHVDQNFSYCDGPLRAAFNRLAARYEWTDEEYRENWYECLISEIEWRLDFRPEDRKAARLRKLCAAHGIPVQENTGVKECEEVSSSFFCFPFSFYLGIFLHHHHHLLLLVKTQRVETGLIRV